MEALLKSSREGVTVTKCTGGMDGVECATNGVFDFVLLDLRLDGEDGLDVLADLRKVQPRLPVIVLSGQGGGPDIVAAVRAGAIGYITKTGLLHVGIWPAIDRAMIKCAPKKN